MSRTSPSSRCALRAVLARLRFAPAWLAVLALGFSASPARALSTLAPAAFKTRAQAASEVRVTAQIDPPVIKFGDRATLRITAENTGDARVGALPEVDGLEIGRLLGPSLTSSVAFVAGRRSVYQQLTWQAELRPEREGDFEIPAIGVDVGGKTVFTRPLSFKASRDLSGAELGFLEIVPSSRFVVEGQPFSVKLTFGWVEQISSRINSADLSLPWIDQLPGVLPLEVPESNVGSRPVPLSVNRSSRLTVQQVAPVTRDEKRFVTFELTRHYLATRPGVLEFGASALEFAHVEQSNSFFRTSTNRSERFFVLVSPFEVEVGEVPEEGRPFDYTGAVGNLVAEGRADLRDVDAGDSIKLTVEWSGEGNLEFFDLPDPSRMEAFRGFRVYGAVTTEKRFDRRKAVFDLAPIDPSVSRIPPLPLRVFDPEQQAYVTVSTPAIPIRVRALAGAGLDEEETSEPGSHGDVGDIETAPLSDAPPDRGLFLEPRQAGGALAGVLGLWLVGRMALRKRRGNPDGPRERRRRRARRELARELTARATPSERLAALQAFLAARTDEASIAWVGRDARAWSRGQGEPGSELDAELAEELDRTVEALERAAWAPSAAGEASARDGGPDRRELLALAGRLTRGGL